MKLNTILPLTILTIFASCNVRDQTSSENKAEETAQVNVGDIVSGIGKNIHHIFQDNQNNLWFASDGEGLYKYDGKIMLQLTDKTGLCGNNVRLIQQHEDSTLLILTSNGVCSFNGNLFQSLHSKRGNLNPTEFSTATLLRGSYYQDNSLTDFQLPHTSKLDKTYSQTPYAIYCSFKDSKGNIWFGTESRGVCKYDGKTYTWLDSEELGLAIRCIFEDKSGNIWIGNNGYGLFRYDGKTLTNFTKEHQLDNPDFQNTMKGKEGTLARVWTIADNINGDLLIGTIDAGLWKYDGENLTNYTVKDGLSSNSISTIFRDNKGKVWIGTDQGLTIYDGRTFTAFEQPDIRIDNSRSDSNKLNFVIQSLNVQILR
jgi:ligand-binding sensor domain-containing protein